MDDTLASQLLASIEANRLIILCGAGLSMAAPSSVPSAWQVAQDCAAKYEEITGATIPQYIKDDLGQLADYFADRNELVSIFIRRLIPWQKFRQTSPNSGHVAIADFLACGVFQAGITTNVDYLVEEAGLILGEPNFQSALSGVDANVNYDHKPFLKIHGCCIKDIDNTVWSRSQLNRNPLEDRIRTSSEWLTANLREKDVLIVGFWSDWGYLNSIFEECVREIEPNRVILVDPSEAERLEEKAPEIWAWALSGRVAFEHVQESGANFLDELRKRYSKNFFERLFNHSRHTYQALTSNMTDVEVDFSGLTSEDLYAFRRDACGQPVGKVIRQKYPTNSMRLLGAIHMALVANGAVLNGAAYTLGGIIIRIVQGAGQLLSEVMKRYTAEPPPTQTYDIVICAGAMDDGGVPSNIVRGHSPGNIIRPGVSGRWLTHQQAFNELGI